MSKRPMFRTTAVFLDKAQTAWVCQWCFNVTTSSQFTDVSTSANASHRNPLVALAKGWLSYRRVARSMAARPGERSAKGWL